MASASKAWSSASYIALATLMLRNAVTDPDFSFFVKRVFSCIRIPHEVRGDQTPRQQHLELSVSVVWCPRTDLVWR